MTTATMTAATLTTIARTAGIDINAHGAKATFARILGVRAQRVRDSFRKDVVSDDVAEAAEAFAKKIAAGTYVPETAASAPEPVDTDDMMALVDPDFGRSDEEILADINDRFECMTEFVECAIDGSFKSVLVTGPGGIGKTFPIERMLRDYQEENPEASVVCVSGAISAVGLVEALWNTQNKGDVLLIDDADGGLAQVDFMNVLKAATDSKGRRVVSWMKQNKALAEAGVESQFEYAGSVIIISNANLTAKAEKGNGHIDAILSRAMHIDLGINSTRSLALRVKYMIEEVGMFAQQFAIAGMSDLHDEAAVEISDFIVENKDNFRSLTLREADKIAKMFIAATKRGRDWKRMARLSLGAL